MMILSLLMMTYLERLSDQMQKNRLKKKLEKEGKKTRYILNLQNLYNKNHNVNRQNLLFE